MVHLCDSMCALAGVAGINAPKKDLMPPTILPTGGGGAHATLSAAVSALPTDFILSKCQAWCQRQHNDPLDSVAGMQALNMSSMA
mmetsp:Transcript_124587/g.242685  ORF Transcript_124587/g.242685 Transcript_124587/m.242685 type:complete len:85 (-) Transcript_124587:2-256(-)